MNATTLELPIPSVAHALPRHPHRHHHHRRVGPCRLASVLIDQHRGLPAFTGINPIHGELVPAEQSLWAVGIQGLNGRGRLFNRAALYACDTHACNVGTGRWKLVFHADYGPDGQPLLRGLRPPSPSRLAALNWVAAALFAAPSHAPAGPYAVAPAAAARYLHREVPRREFAAERSPQAAADLFTTWCEPLFDAGDVPAGLGFRVPHVTPLLTGDQLPPGVPVDQLAVESRWMQPAAVRGHAVGRFTLGLHRTDGDGFLGLKRAFIQQFDVAQRLLDAGNVHALAHQSAAALSSLRAQSLAYLTTVGVNESTAAAPLDSLAGALRLLGWFYRRESRAPDGRVIMYVPGRPKADPGIPADKLAGEHTRLFNRPAARGVGGCPVELVDGFLSDGSFPANGGELTRGLPPAVN